jgi:hypothetical protein
VRKDGRANLGQQIAPLEGGPTFVNPGKYVIPAGGIEEGYFGPGLKLLSARQSLVNGTISMINPYHAAAGEVHTLMEFVKYWREPGEIEINPSEQTLLLYAVSPALGDDNGNPEWKYTSLNLLEDSSGAPDSGIRKRHRQHANAET